MTPGQPDVIEQVPAGGNVMQPSSGTYGDVADTERLKRDLNLPVNANPAAVQPTAQPPGMPQGQSLPPTPGGVPDVLLRPSAQPDVAPSTPLGAGQEPSFPQGSQARIQALQALVSSGTTSQATKDWAREVLRMLGQ